MKLIHLLAAGVFVISLGAGVAQAASHPQDHHGFFIGFNVGAGTADISSDGADGDREWGGAGNLRLGGAIKNNLLLGAESSAWAKDENGTNVSLSTVALAVTYYPVADQGFFLRGGMGLASSSVEIEQSNGFKLSKDETGFGLVGAMGYEWRLTGKFALGPQVEFVYLNIGGDLVDTANFFDATLGFNWYW